MKIFYSDLQPFVLPEGHIYPADKYILLRRELAAQGILSQSELFPALPASEGQILLVHSAEYYQKVIAGKLNPHELRTLGLPWSERLVQRAHLGVGAVIAAAQEALIAGTAGSLSGGTHHAFPSEGRGFCVFNDIAIAIVDLFQKGSVSRAAVIDLDDHQGNGTADIFHGSKNVIVLDIYGSKNFPVRKVKAHLDIALPAGADDDLYLETLEHALPAVFAAQPEIVFYIGGVDPLRGDRFNSLNLTLDGLQARDEMVFTACCHYRVPVVLTMGGGYSSVETTVKAHINTYRAVQKVFRSQMV